MPNITELTVRYAETDCMGVVHHAVYPVWFEVARTDYIKAAGLSYADMEKGGVMLPVSGISCRYRLPARYDDTLLIEARISRFTPARIEFEYKVTRKGETEVLATGTSSHGFVDAETFRPLNFKKAMPEFYAVMEKHAERDCREEK
ncbi:MAG: acyl-CoA thioesterase [Oscillospiraceae bacterium]|nr:acyl-CoA thioesterase [Oscillospiraceae bacterium]